MAGAAAVVVAAPKLGAVRARMTKQRQNRQSAKLTHKLQLDLETRIHTTQVEEEMYILCTVKEN